MKVLIPHPMGARQDKQRSMNIFLNMQFILNGGHDVIMLCKMVFDGSDDFQSKPAGGQM